MRNKLRVDRPIWYTDREMVEYVFDRTEGLAYKRLDARDRRRPFTTAEEALAELQRGYGAHDRIAKSQAEMDKLRQGSAETFEEFWPRFEVLAVELGWNDQEQIYNLEKKILPRLQSRIADGTVYLAVDDMVTRLRTLDHQLERFDQRRPKQIPNSAPKRPAIAKPFPRAFTATNEIKPSPAPPAERARLMAEGRCLNCKGLGHIAADPSCPMYKRRDSTFKRPFRRLHNNAAVVDDEETFTDDEQSEEEFTEEEATDEQGKDEPLA